MSIMCESLLEYELVRSVNESHLNEGVFDNKYVEYFKNASKDQLIAILNNPKLRDKRIHILSAIMAGTLGLSKMTVDSVFNYKLNNNPAFQEIVQGDADLSTIDKLKTLVELSGVAGHHDVSYGPDGEIDEPGDETIDQIKGDVSKGNKKQNVKINPRPKPKLNPDTGDQYYSYAEIKTWNLDNNDYLKPRKGEAPFLEECLRSIKNRSVNANSNGVVNLDDVTISNQGIMELKAREKFKIEAYVGSDTKNVTVGYGTAFKSEKSPYKKGDKTTVAKAHVYLYGRLGGFEHTVGKALRLGAKRNPAIKNMPQRSVDMLISLCYNTGSTGFEDTTLYNELIKGNIDNVISVWKRTKIYTETDGKLVKSQGLINRRAHEVSIFSKGYDKSKKCWK